MKNRDWKKYAWEFFTIFIAVISAFSLNNWNDNRRDANAKEKILIEIRNGLTQDLEDIAVNVKGHQDGIRAARFWRAIIRNQPVIQDTVFMKFVELTRDFTSLQNVSAYETLKSKGLEIIENDSLRAKLISLYEYDYQVLRKFEEEYEEMQFQKSYFDLINKKLAPYFVFDEKGYIVQVETPLNLSKSDSKLLLSYLFKIEGNRNFLLRYYDAIKKNINQLKTEIEEELSNGK